MLTTQVDIIVLSNKGDGQFPCTISYLRDKLKEGDFVNIILNNGKRFDGLVFVAFTDNRSKITDTEICCLFPNSQESRYVNVNNLETLRIIRVSHPEKKES